MQKKSFSEYFDLGTLLRYLHFIQVTTRLSKYNLLQRQVLSPLCKLNTRPSTYQLDVAMDQHPIQRSKNKPSQFTLQKPRISSTCISLQADAHLTKLPYQGGNLSKNMTSPKVPSNEILSAQHLSLYQKSILSLPSHPKAKVLREAPTCFKSKALHMENLNIYHLSFSQ